MQSLVGSNLFRHNKCLIKHLRRWVRYQPLVIDKPPDYYQTIEQKLNQINYFENAKHLVDIGFTTDSDIKKKWNEVIISLENINSEDKVLEDEEEDNQRVLNYKLIYDKWLLSEEGIKSTIDLANHYSIFRDLFPPKPQIQSISSVEDLPPKPIYFFSPLVPLKAEFCVNESDIEDNNKNSEKQLNDLIFSPVFRGNILYPEKCINCPNVTIDSSAINGINNLENREPNKDSAEEVSGRISLINDDSNYYTLCLINLDSHFGEESNVCHWMTTNIHNEKRVTNFETVVKYLPVYGVRGLGYHRFVFLLYKHKNPLNLEKVNDFDLKKRKFNAFEFMSAHESDCLTPVGMSWFQTTWDYSSQKIFFNYLDMRSPHYEWLAPKDKLFKQLQFPARAPFNIYLDRWRDPKDIAKGVLLERLKAINPYKSYENMFDKSPVPPQIHPIPIGTPDWLKASIRKRRAKLGIYRGLRPHSAIEPNDNNPDLDRPKWPRIQEEVHPLNQPIPYPDGHRRPKPLRETKWVLPPNEHPTYRIEHPHGFTEDEDKQKLSKSK